MISHLLHVGYPKTGSKSLQRWFEAHPRIAYTQGGIVGAMDTMGLVENFAFTDGLDCAVTSFEGFTFPLSDHRDLDSGVFAQLAPRREALLRLAEALVSFFPNARVLIVTRGLREIMRSFHGEAVRHGVVEPLDEFCRSFFLNRASGEVPVDYNFTIGLFERLFGADRVIVLPYELLRDHPGRFVRAIEEALGISHSPMPLERVHPSLSPAELYWYRRVGRLLTSLPARPAGARRLLRLHLKLVRGNHLGRVVRLVERIRRSDGPFVEDVPEWVIEALRGSTTCLRDRPLYSGLETEYLL